MNPITNTLRKCREVIRIDFKTLQEYRYEILSLLCILPVKTMFLVFLWNELFDLPANQGTYDKSWVLSYFIMVSLFEFIITPFCAVTYELMQDIKGGNLDMYLIRPFNYFLYRYVSRSKQLLMGICLILLYALYNNAFLLFPIMIYFFMVSTLILFLLFAIFGILSFIVENVLTFRDNVWNIIKLFSGAIVPLSFYPKWLHPILNHLPFSYIYAKPITVLLSSNSNIPYDVIVSIFWLFCLGIVLHIVWKKALFHYSSQGG